MVEGVNWGLSGGLQIVVGAAISRPPPPKSYVIFMFLRFAGG